MDNKIVDVRGQDCPVPLTELRRAVEASKSGQVIKVLFTCPNATNSLPDYCEKNGVEILGMSRENSRYWTIKARV